MPEAVIVATARTPIGRAFKGSLVDLRPDDLTAFIVRAALEKVPELDPHSVEDLIVGCGQPAGEAGFNVARVAAVLAGTGRRSGRHRQSLLLLVASDDSHGGPRDSRRRRRRLRRRRGRNRLAIRKRCGRQRSGHQPPLWRRDRAHEGAHAQSRCAMDSPDRACPTSTSPWARPQRTWPSSKRSHDLNRTSSPAQPGARRRTPEEWLLRTRDHSGHDPDGTIVAKDDGPRDGTTLEKLQSLQPVFREGGTVTAGNACPLNDGAAAVIVMSDTRAKELGITPLARIVASGVSALNPEIMGLGPIEASRQALARAGMSVADLDLVEINEAFAAQVLPSAKHLEIPLDKVEHSRRGDRPGPPLWHDRRAHHDDLDQLTRGRGQALRTRDDVRRRRPRHGHDRRATELATRLRRSNGHPGPLRT